jgi:ribosomal protein S18 acetylase RimI-like enzyme
MAARSGLVAEYLFGGNADDTSGGGHHGVVVGATPCPDRFGRPDGAYLFDGVDDHIAVAPPPQLRADALSVSAWVRYEPQAFGGSWSNCIVCQDDGNDADQSRRVFQLSTFGSHVVWHRMVGARDPVFTRRVQPGTWYHLAAVYEGGIHRLYADGVLYDSVEHGFWTHADEPLYIGRKGTAEPCFFFRGAIDDVRIYDRALSAGDVLALFHEGGFEKPPPAPIGPSEDLLSGKWGQDGVTFLDLTCDANGTVTGRIMAGEPWNMAPIATGTFDRATARLTLEGDARSPRDGSPVHWRLEGMYDEGEVSVSATFNDYRGNFTLTKKGARRHWWKRSRLRQALRSAGNRALRYVFGLKRRSRSANARLLRRRGESLASFAVRDATAADIPALSRVHVAAWNATYKPMGGRGPSVDIREQQWRVKFAKPDQSWFCLLVVDARGTIVGFAHGHRDEGEGEGAGTLSKIYLLTEYQRVGLGRLLMGHAARRFLANGVTRMALHVDPRNPSCAFYERLGGRHPRDRRGHASDGAYTWSDLQSLAASCPVA